MNPVDVARIDFVKRDINAAIIAIEYAMTDLAELSKEYSDQYGSLSEAAAILEYVLFGLSPEPPY